MSRSDCSRLRRMLLKSLPLGAISALPVPGHAVPDEESARGGSRPIAMVLPFPPGGSVDIVARQLQPGLKAGLRQTVVVDNKPGAGGLIASSTVARARPDGHTFLMAFDTHAINPFAYKKLPYDTFRDFTPVSQLVRFPLVVAAHPSLPVSNVRELVELGRQKPESVRYASSGVGSLNQLAAEALATESGMRMLHVPYKGGGPAVQAVLSNDVDLFFSSYAAVQAHVAAKTIKVLGVTGTSRLRQLPQVPTVAEQGYPGFEAYSWIGVFGPAGMSTAVVTRMHDALAGALRMPRVVEALGAQGFEIVAGSPADLGNLVRQEHDKWYAVARKANIQFD
ncbi:tripartite tricarboxylate transporter substrate binding protein [Cupriavidus respiraculi]|uniref:tripartite tricarboxylate transporter substrate binding protein n=1 Tax=Cupriavidus respiraculi TaxID=195930 RepID=UPI001C989774|nr:tripartite tricarboxylate transporter substrate binding protein [Cupriavidus respiraculi]MBY4949228.1 tripartite tricarboxylate transporter substrate binding protein [Cupriavidus respiraculi]